MINPDLLLTRFEAAIYLGVKENTLAVWKSKGNRGPNVTKIGRLVKYRLSDLENFILKGTVK